MRKHSCINLFGSLSLALIGLAGWQQALFAADPATPVQRWGALRVENARLVSQDGAPVQLKGPSLFDTSSYGQYANADSLRWLRDDWQATVFRAAMYTEYNGSFVGAAAFKPLYQAVDAAIETGMYVLVDWHILSDGNPQKYKAQALAFFDETSRKYANVPNVIYEICNEPNGLNINWPDVIKPYAQEIIPVIRKNSPSAVILVGTPVWSSEPQTAAQDPLAFNNLLYVMHYYAGTHDINTWLSRLDQALAKGAAVFVTEWGTTSAQVSGRVFPTQSITWARELAKRNISWANWSLGTKLEPSSMLKPNVSVNGGWTAGDLTDSGLLVRALMRNDPETAVFAENFESGNFKAGGWVRQGAGINRADALSGQVSCGLQAGQALTKTLSLEAVAKPRLKLLAAGKLAGNGSLVIEWGMNGDKDWRVLARLGAKDIQAGKPGSPLSLALPAEAAGQSGFQFRIRVESGAESLVRIDDVELSGSLTGL
jgi:endoglucanase